jgi:hypothetical protein
MAEHFRDSAASMLLFKSFRASPMVRWAAAIAVGEPKQYLI